MFLKHVCSPKLECHCDLDLWPRNPKFNRGHLLDMTNHHTKLEDPCAKSFLVIDRTRFVFRPTDGPTNGPTCASNINPSSSKGGGITNWTQKYKIPFYELIRNITTYKYKTTCQKIRYTGTLSPDSYFAFRINEHWCREMKRGRDPCKTRPRDSLCEEQKPCYK